MGGRRGSVYTLEEAGKMESTAVMYGCKDSEGG